MASGVSCAADVKTEFAAMKTKNAYKYMMFRLSDDKTEIIIDNEMCKKGEGKKEDRDAKQKHEEDQACWQSMVDTLVSSEPKYIVFDIENTSKDGRKINKILFISWCADDCPVKKRMIHAASEDYLKKSLEGILGTIIQAHDKGDLEYEDAIKIAITRD